MFQFVFTASFARKKKAVHEAAKLAGAVQVANAKRAAASLVREFQEGLRNNDLRLRKLKPATVAAKTRKAMVLPRNPLYGLGDYDPDTLINAFYVREFKTQVRVVASKRKHHPAKGHRSHHKGKGQKTIRIDELLFIHEHGATIQRGGRLTVLPPRPAVRLSFERAMRKLSKKTAAREMRKGLAEFIQKSKSARLREMTRFNTREKKILDSRR